MMQNINKNSILLLIAIIFLYALTFIRYYKSGLNASYYNGMNFETKVVNKIDKNIAFDTSNSLLKGVNNNFFSVKWNGYIYIPKDGNYTFITHNDDGLKLYINDQLLIDDWKSHPMRKNTAVINLKEGKQRIRIMYYDHTGKALLKLFWKTPNSRKKLLIPTKSFSYV